MIETTIHNPALGVVPMHWRTTTVHSRVTSVSLMWTTPDGNVCMYVNGHYNDRTAHEETQDDGSGEGGLANIL